MADWWNQAMVGLASYKEPTIRKAVVYKQFEAQ
jgi:hypothetical protein